jgi:geranylgeranyl diphosphate synthase type II
MTIMTSLNETYFIEKRRKIEHLLQEVLPSTTTPPYLLHRAMRYAVMAPGKRVRPILCIIACEVSGGDESQALLPACAIELFHTYTLIHDDLPCMDDDDYRRGQLSCHTVFGDAIAVLAGDALQALAFDLLVKAQKSSSTVNQKDYVSELAEIASTCGVVGGQSIEIECGEKGMTLETIEQIHFMKTATLFKASARIGAMAGNASQNQIDCLSAYALNLGMAFQFVDDVIDASDRSSTGVTSGKKKRHEFNSVNILGMEVASERANHFTLQAESAIARFEGKNKQLLIDFARWLLKRKS